MVVSIKPKALYRLILIGFTLNALLYIIPPELVYPHSHQGLRDYPIVVSQIATVFSVICLYLGLFYVHDQEHLLRLQSTGREFTLDQRGINEINQSLEVESEIIHEDEDFGSWSIYSPTLSHDLLDHLSERYTQYEAKLDVNQEGVPIRFEDHIVVRTLPYLPLVHHREQVGLFATQTIPSWSLLYWTGDIGVAYASDQHRISKVAHMNRRTLVTMEGVDFFQGGSEQQRSGSAILANFFWCDTKTTDLTQSDYRILPANFLGEPNCVYVTTLKGDTACSALLSFKEIQEDEQLLMFTGSAQQGLSIDRRLRLYHLIPFIILIALVIPILQLSLCLSQ